MKPNPAMRDAATAPESLPLGPGVRVLAAHATGLLALGKPAGVLSHPNGPGVPANALLRAEYDADAECYRFAGPDGAQRRVWLLNRLDSPTSGVVLVATDGALAAHIKALFARREIDKVYHAVVKGARLIPDRGVWRDALRKSGGGGDARFVRASAGAGGAPAESHYRWERGNRTLPALSLLRLEPKTGRTHQLRIQCALHGHPILGDKTYGDFPLNKTLAARDTRFDRLFLHCSRTAFRYEWAGATHDFLAESPAPEEFAAVLGGDAPARPVSDRLNIRLRPGRR